MVSNWNISLRKFGEENQNCSKIPLSGPQEVGTYLVGYKKKT